MNGANVIGELRFRGYRCFRDEQVVALTRLSLLYGENNAGKSALARLLPWLKASRTIDSIGLDPSAALWEGAGWRDLVWRGPAGPEDDADELDLVVGLALADGDRWMWGSRWRDNKRRFTLEHVVLERAPGGPNSRFETRPTRADVSALDGILPRPGPGGFPDDAISALQQALSGVIWLGARRLGPKRGGSPRGAGGRIHGDGAETDGLVLGSRELRERVSGWYYKHFMRSLEVEALGSDMERLVLAHPSHSSAFPDTGEGVQRAFSVVVALEYLRESGGVLVIEEPESNLHPRLQSALADLAVEVLVERPDARVLLETHSEVFLQAAYMAAARALGEEVSISWVEPVSDGSSRVIAVELESDGTPKTDTMKRAFETMGDLRRQVQVARLEARAHPA